MNYINIFQNAHDSSVSVGKFYTEDHLMHIFLDNFHQGGKYTAHISSRQADIRREGKVTDQKYLSISSLQADYLNLGRSSGTNNKKSNIVMVKCTFFGGSYPTDKFWKMKR